MRARVQKKQNIHVLPNLSPLVPRPLCHAIALMLAAGFAGGAYAGGLVNLSNFAAQSSAARGAATTAGMTNLGVSPQQALQVNQPSIQNLATAAQGIAAQMAAQQQAAAAAANIPSNVPNGLAVGGLQVAPGATSNSSLWLNANLPTQSVAGNGQVTVNVQQTAPNAILTWQTMNVGRQTTLNFDQSGGTQNNGANNWLVLNRITDPSGAPSQILGNIKAQGTVLVMNRNGILFGAGSQVNVHSLAVSSLDLLNNNDTLLQSGADVSTSNSLLLNGGLAALEAGSTGTLASNFNVPTELLGLGNTVSVTSASQFQAPGNITIAPGASITTHANGSVSDGGFVLVAAPNVSNAGSITADDGQVILAAGLGVSLLPNSTSPQVLLPELTGKISLSSYPNGSTDITPAGTLTNTGIVRSARGNLNLLGSNVLQDGVLGVTTSVSTPGRITISTVDESVANPPSIATNPAALYPGASLVTATNGMYGTNRAGQLVFGTGSVTSIAPDLNGQTATSSPSTIFTPGSINLLTGSTWFQSGSLIDAPGSNVTITALSTSLAAPSVSPGVQGRIYVDTGANIDVSGLANVELPIADTFLTVPRIGPNELANAPLLRNGFLNGLKNVIIDSTLSGTNSDGLQWVGSPLLNLAGYVSLMPRSIDQLLSNGGSINFSGAQVMTAAGSLLNLNGGYLHYLGGIANTTRLLDAGGLLVPIGQASPNDTYVGVAGQFVVHHPRWNVTDTWINPLLTGGVNVADYISGGNAGTLNVYASQAAVLDGAITADAVVGSKQVQGNLQPAGGAFNLGGVIGSTFGIDPGATLNMSGESGLVVLQSTAPQLSTLAAGFGANTPLNTSMLGALAATDPNNILATTVVPVDTLNSGGFAKVNVTEDKTGGAGIVVAAGSQLAVQPGGAITLSNPSAHGGITVLGDLLAPAGTISIAAGGGNVTVGPQARLSVAGQWINNDTQTSPGTTPGDSRFINGGSISLSTALASSANGATASSVGAAPVLDTTGSIVLQAGSVLDVSSGGELQSNGQLLMQNGIPVGSAGSLSLITYASDNNSEYGVAGSFTPALPALQPTAGRIQMDGSIDSYGFSGGGTLTLQALGLQLGGRPAQAPSWALALPANFFAQQGFGQYVLNAIYDATVAPGATLALTQQNLIPDVPLLRQAASGADLSNSGLTTPGTLDAYHRQPTNLTLTAGNYLNWRVTGSQNLPTYAGVTGAVTLGQGASVIGDAGARIGLGSSAQVTVLGSLIAPGGAITLSADSSPSHYAFNGQLLANAFTSPSKSLWLGPNAVLDVAGTALINPLAAPVKSGTTTFVPSLGRVLPGGSVTLSDDSGYVVAQAGALLNVSGASASFDQLQANGGYAPQAVWSNAGSITLAAGGGLYFDGTLQAQPGAAQAQGGTLSIAPEPGVVTQAPQPGGGSFSAPGATALLLQQSGELVPAGLAPGQNLSGTPTGVLQFSVDRLNDSGISTLVLGSPSVPGSTRSQAVPITFSGNLNLNLGNALIVNAGQLVALSSSQAQQLLSTPNPQQGQPSTLAGLLAGEAAPTTVGAPTVSISAPYVAFIGPVTVPSTNLMPVQALADGTLQVNAGFIDLENQFQLNNFAQANFVSSGAIRFSSTMASSAAGSPNALQAGELFTPGNLGFQAADLYPSTGSTFVLDAVGPTLAGTGAAAPTNITFLGKGGSGVPLSAGGSLLVDATTIVQSGTVQAPSGRLIFGVGDTSNTVTQAQFNGLPLVATSSVTLGSGSLTSVSNTGTVIPYGSTVDGVEWQFNPVPNASAAPDLSAPPAKFVSVNGNRISLNPGAMVDLTGGGDLQAQEWVPGTGGSRDLLSQYNVSYATTPSGVALPVNPGATNVYAIMPGVQAPVAAYDPVLAQTLQPALNANGSVASTTLSIGVGQAALNSAPGQSIYLPGAPGLAAGIYTLLPAKYATLPGAFRVTVSNSNGAVLPGASQTLPDGTVQVAGYTVNALDGSHSSTATLFNLQSGPVWQQYSQYNLSSANSFFPSLAAGAGNVTPPLPMDAGQLVLAASQGLTLGATLKTAGAPGGAPAQVDIASQDIQIVGSGEAALPGYLQIGASQLDALGAGSLLIGGTRTASSSGIGINPLANSVVLSNDSSNPLSGPEIILVTKAGATGTDPNAANGLQISAGSVLSAQGNYPAAKDQTITIGQNANSVTRAPAISGDGALLSVSNGGAVNVTRLDTSGTGLLTIGAGAALNGGRALTLDSSGNLISDPSAKFVANAILVDGSAITFTNQTGAAAAALPGFVVGAAQLAQLANAQQVTLRSSGAMNFDGNLAVTFGNNVDLSAASFSGDGGVVTLNGPQIAFTNELGGVAPATVNGQGTLNVNATQLDFGSGNKTLSGFGAANFTASGAIVGQNSGVFNLGGATATMAAPVYWADTGSAQTIESTGLLNLNSTTGSALKLTPAGGALGFIAGTINDNALLEAPAGNLSLEASTGNLTLGSAAVLSSAGVAKQFFDVTRYAPAGAITLTADTGAINLAAGATLDFSGTSGGGAAGSLTVSAPQQSVNLSGTLKGTAAAGYTGGSFSLDTGGAVNLDQLATELATSGVNNAIAVQTNSGNLTLSKGNTLAAQSVSLSANGGAGGQDPNNGNLQILGSINASGAAGGQIGLYGKSGVDVEGSLLAVGSSPSQRGGTIKIDTSGTPGSVVGINNTYGYENIAAANSGVITLGNQALIDVSGGTAGGLTGGTVSLRAPLLSNGGVNVTLAPGAVIRGARSVDLEAYAVWSTTDPSTGAQHFDGIIDPAGWYDGNGNLLAGTFTTPAGASFSSVGLSSAQIAADLSNDYFTPTTANTNHETLFGYLNGNLSNAASGTLMSFIQGGLSSTPVFASQFANVANFQAVPGVELDNPSAAVNSGNISVLSNWNLGAGLPNNSGTIVPAYRYQGTVAPILTLRTLNNVVADASISDGFYQNQVATILGGVAASGGGSNTTYATANLLFGSLLSKDSGAITVEYTNQAVQPLSALDTNASLNAPLTGQSPAYYTNYVAYANAWDMDYSTWGLAALQGPHIYAIAPLAKPAALPSLAAADANAATYYGPTTTAGSYLSWLHTMTRLNVPTFGTPPPLAFPSLTADYPSYIVAYTGYIAWTQISKSLPNKGASTNFFYAPAAPAAIPFTGYSIGVLPGNAPANVPTPNNPLPLAFATLLGGQSTSYRIVAGADFSSVDPLGLQPLSTFSNSSSTLNGGGSVSLNAHTVFVDSNGRALLDPTMIRTGTGSIDLTAGNNIALLDPTAPGVIYTGGAPAVGAPVGGNPSIVGSQTNATRPNILVTQALNPDSGGDITLHAQNNIVGLENATDASGAVTGVQGANISQFWWPWLEIGANPSVNAATQAILPISQTSIDFGAFDQGVMSVGGNVSVSAGGNIQDLAVSLPTTWYLNSSGAQVTVGGGNLAVHAAGNILSGDYFVARGTGSVIAGGQIAADSTMSIAGTPGGLIPNGPVSTVFALQDAVLDVVARQGVDIAGVIDPSYVDGIVPNYQQHADFQPYSSTSAINVISTTGNVGLGTLAVAVQGSGGISLIGSSTSSGMVPDFSYVLPATVNLTAFNGGIAVEASGDLFPSTTGNLNLLADQSITLSNEHGSGTNFGMIDQDPLSMPSPTQPYGTVSDITAGTLAAHDATPLHANDTTPVRIYSLNGSLVDGMLEPAGAANAGLYDHLLSVVLDKPALIEAGADIVNLVFQGQNLRDADITRIVAGHDIDDTPFAAQAIAPRLVLGGPGAFDIEAGRNLGPLTSVAQQYAVLGSDYTSALTGIDAVGNADNPNLPHQSAKLQVLFGVGPGIDLNDFVASYINPANVPAVGINNTPALIAFMEQYDAGQSVDTGLVAGKQAVMLNAAQAWTQFQALPAYVQQLFAEQVLFNVLSNVGQDYNTVSSPYYQQYARGYQAINTLFPAALGYTANALGGGANGANQTIDTGNLDIRNTTIQTQQGGDILILGPGGRAQVGSTVAPPEIIDGSGKVIAGPGTQGILTLEQGSIDILLDQSLLLAQSRVFTEQGGNLTIWSSNGDINAGKGASSSADIPQPNYTCDPNHYCRVDARGEVTGAGIATLQTLAGAISGNVNLIAPRGTVDAGAAGIRVSGNLNIAALHVANADNISVQGTAIGVPTAQSVNTGDLTAAGSAASAVTQMAQNIVKNNAAGVPQRHWQITVEVEGFGEQASDNSTVDNSAKKKRSS